MAICSTKSSCVVTFCGYFFLGHFFCCHGLLIPGDDIKNVLFLEVPLLYPQQKGQQAEPGAAVGLSAMGVGIPVATPIATPVAGASPSAIPLASPVASAPWAAPVQQPSAPVAGAVSVEMGLPPPPPPPPPEPSAPTEGAAVGDGAGEASLGSALASLVEGEQQPSPSVPVQEPGAQPGAPQLVAQPGGGHYGGQFVAAAVPVAGVAVPSAGAAPPGYVSSGMGGEGVVEGKAGGVGAGTEASVKFRVTELSGNRLELLVEFAHDLMMTHVVAALDAWAEDQDDDFEDPSCKGIFSLKSILPALAPAFPGDTSLRASGTIPPNWPHLNLFTLLGEQRPLPKMVAVFAVPLVVQPAVVVQRQNANCCVIL